jgi:hypothetical protein
METRIEWRIERADHHQLKRWVKEVLQYVEKDQLVEIDWRSKANLREILYKWESITRKVLSGDNI